MREWPTVLLRDAASLSQGVTLGRKTKETKVARVPYLRVANVQDGRLDMREIKTIEVTADELEKWRLQRGDLLLTEGGDIDKLGRGTCWRNELPLCIHQNHIFRVRLPQSRYDPEFVSFQVGSAYGKAYFLAHAKKTTGIATINQRVLGEFPLLSPPLEVQHRISARLRTHIAALEQVRQPLTVLVAETERLISAIYRQAFCEIVPTSLRPDFETAPLAWRWVKLSDVARLESGHTPSRSRPDWWGGDISWISLTEIRSLDGLWVNETQIKTNQAGLANSAARILPRGTVCFSRTASVGFVAIMGEPMATSQDFANWVCGDELDPEFLMHALIRSRAELRALATGATHKTIYMPALGSFHVCMPKRDEQVRIVQRMKAQIAVAAEMQAAAKAQLDETERLPARLLAQAFDTL